MKRERTPEIQFEREPEEIIADILSRYSVLDLREMSEIGLDIGEDKLRKAEAPVKIVEHGEKNLIRWWRIESGGNLYEVRRFENFCFCSCADFFFKHTVCKHICITARFYCKRCRKREVQFGNMCEGCEADTAAYLKPTPTKPAERVGGIRIN